MRGGRLMKTSVIITSFIFSLLFIVTSAYAGIINSAAPDFSVQDFNNKTVSIKDLRGKVVFINFWASWCAPCRKEMPELSGLAERYKKADVVFLAISVDKQRSNAEGFLSRIQGLSKNMTFVLDKDSRVVSAFNVRAMPTSYLIDKNGVIKYLHFGFNEDDPSRWTEEVDAMLGRK